MKVVLVLKQGLKPESHPLNPMRVPRYSTSTTFNNIRIETVVSSLPHVSQLNCTSVTSIITRIETLV